LNERPARKALLQQIVIEFQTADARRKHSVCVTLVTIKEFLV
jgi:hypothetical protein